MVPLFSVGESVDTMLEAAAAELTAWAAEQIDVHSCMDEAYPGQLRDIHQVPPLLFTRGHLAPTRGRSPWSALMWNGPVKCECGIAMVCLVSGVVGGGFWARVSVFPAVIAA